MSEEKDSGADDQVYDEDVSGLEDSRDDEELPGADRETCVGSAPMGLGHAEPITAADLAEVLPAVAQGIAPLRGSGEIATYIPALARVDAEQFAIAAAPLSGECQAVGAADVLWSIQSISKIFSLTLAMQRVEGELWDRVGREPSGDPFNSLTQLEYESGKPRNPFINAGAIVIADVLSTCLTDPLSELVTLVSELAESTVAVDGEVALSEDDTGFRNRSLAYLMKGFGNIHNDPEDVLDIYFAQCSMAMTARQLARSLRFLANDGVDPGSGNRVLSVGKARRVNALMLTCGTYDAAGEFAFRVGIPCKSGVGGGVVGIVPHHLAACAWSPPLDSTGNSVVGRAALEALIDRTGLSVF